MTSEIRVDTVYNESGDSDSGLDMSTNDQVVLKTADTTALTVDANQNVAIGVTSKNSSNNGSLTVGHTGMTKISASASGNADELVLIGADASANVGMSIIANNSNQSIVYFGDEDDTDIGGITYDHSDNSMSFTTDTSEKIKLQSSNIKLAAQTFQDGVNVAGDYALKVHNDGNNSNRYALNISAGADDASGTNYAIGIKDGDGGDQGFVTFSGGTVTYGAFTAHHEISLPDADKANGYPYGTLLETTAVYYTQKNGSDTERGIRYVTQKSSSQYSRKVLGTYCGDMLAVADSSGTYANNLHQAAVLGDGHIICNNSGGNIKIGDGICSSATAGIGQKADKLCMIMGIAQKDITFSGSETVLVPVQYGLQQYTPWTD